MGSLGRRGPNPIQRPEMNLYGLTEERDLPRKGFPGNGALVDVFKGAYVLVQKPLKYR